MRFDLPDPVHGRPPPSDDPLLLDVPIALGAQAPRAARAVVAGVLVEWMPAAVVERAQLVVSELITNSLLHSGAGHGEHATLTLRAWERRCRIEVEDAGRGGAIAPRSPDLLNGGGMGLNLVAAVSECWGVIREGDGPNRVWAQLVDADGAGLD
jgi:anti-sigma regulatory factor (Ser/Thr protein kinase)